MSAIFQPVRYGIIYILMTFAMMGCAILFEYFNVKFPSGISTVLPPMMAALLCGQHIGRQITELPEKNRLWQVAGYMTLIVAAINTLLVLTLFLVPATTTILSELNSIIPAGIWVAIVLFGLLIVFLVNRFFFAMGIKNQVNTPPAESRWLQITAQSRIGPPSGGL